MNSDHAVRPHLSYRTAGHRVREHSVDEVPPANLYRQEHARIRATRTHGVNHGPGVEHHSFPAVEICGRDSEWNAQFFERPHFQCTIEERYHPVVRGKSATRKCPAGKGREAAGVGDPNELVNGNAAAVKSTDERANAGSGHRPHRNAFFLKNSQYTDVSDAARETSTKSNTNGWTASIGCRNYWAGEASDKCLYRPENLPQTHANPTSGLR